MRGMGQIKWFKDVCELCSAPAIDNLKHYTALNEIIAVIEWRGEREKVKRFRVLAMIIFIELVKWIFPPCDGSISPRTSI